MDTLAKTDDYIVLDKPAGIAVEPPSKDPTLLDLLINEKILNISDWSPEDRFGVVHRLDTNTSGVLIWAKNKKTQQRLKKLWQGRQVKKTYLALVVGETSLSGTVELPIRRDNKKDRQTIDLLSHPNSRPAITQYDRLEVGEYRGKKISYLKLYPITGRTHQIRVHLKAIGHPILGDELYGEKADRELSQALEIKRQLLHAYRLEIPGEPVFQADPPEDFCKVLRIVLPKTPSSE